MLIGFRKPSHDRSACAFAVLTLVVGLAGGCDHEGSSAKKERLAPDPVAEQGKATDASKHAWSGENPFEVPAIAVNGNAITITLTRKPDVALPAGRVPYTAETYTVSAKPRGDRVTEADVLGTGLALDLNGDGDTKDQVPVACKSGVIIAGDARVAPLGDAKGEVLTYGSDRIGRIGEAGAAIVSYAPCTRSHVTVGLSPATKPIETIHSNGPVLQVLVFSPADSPMPQAPMDMRLSTGGADLDLQVHAGLVFEPIFGNEPAWASMHWVMAPLEDAASQTFELTLPDTANARLVVARVNLSAAEGTRRRMQPAAMPIP